MKTQNNNSIKHKNNSTKIHNKSNNNTNKSFRLDSQKFGKCKSKIVLKAT